MKRRLTGILLTMCMALGLSPTAALAAGTTSTATPSKTGFVMNGQPVSVTQAYTVSNTNFLQLRAIAALLNGTVSQFNVGWDGQYAVIEPGKPFSGIVTASELKSTTNIRISGTRFKMGDSVFSFAAALLIDGDTNYLNLREFAMKLSGTASQFNLYWDGTAGKAVIQPGVAYTGTSGTDGIVPATPAATATPAANPAVSLYKVQYARGIPFRMSPDGETAGEIPVNTVLNVASVADGWAKTTWNGYDCLVKTDGLTKVSTPDFVASPWAKEWLAYTGSYIGTAGEWTGVKQDWTKPVTRSEMADLLVGIMYDIYGDWSVQYTLPIAIKSTGKLPLTDTGDFQENRLAYWGVVPAGKFNPNAPLTYGEMTGYLSKLMAYEDKYITEGGRQDFTAADIAKFGIGGNTAATATCTYEQAKVLCDKAFVWRTDVAYRMEATYESARKSSNDDNGGIGVAHVATGDLYTIRTCLGTKGQQPHVVMNAEGKVELSSTKKQSYKISYKGIRLREDRSTAVLCTIQTTDGKYLATSGLPVNGSRLVTQATAYVWEIRLGGFLDGQQMNYLVCPVNPLQVLNVSGWKTADGTPVISWLWNQGTGSDNNNCGFIFERAK